MQGCKLLKIEGNPTLAIFELRDGRYWDGARIEGGATTPMPDGFYVCELTPDGCIVQGADGNDVIKGPYVSVTEAERKTRKDFATYIAFWKDLGTLSAIAETRDDVIALIPQALDLVLRHYPGDDLIRKALSEALSELSGALISFYEQEPDAEGFYTERGNHREFDVRGYKNAALAAWSDAVEQAMAEMWKLMRAEIERRGLKHLVANLLLLHPDYTIQ
jgi:predicted RNase H-like HicB family nuclease